MITRIWHGKTKKADAAKYRQYVIDTGIRDYLDSKGNLNVQIWQADDKELTDIYTVTNWDNVESIKKFAGNDYEKARYYPEDQEYLLELEEKVKHYNAYSFSNREIKNYIKQVENLYNGDNWTDENFIKKLSSVDNSKAFLQPANGKHSVAEILWHCIYWRRVLLKRMQGDWEFGKKTEKEQNFLPLKDLKQKGWDNLKKEFSQTNELLIDFLKTKDDEFLDLEYNLGYNYRYMVEGIISHDYYHLGQIGLVISLLDSKTMKKTNSEKNIGMLGIM